VRAQQATVPVVGYVQSGAPDLSENLTAAFRQGMGDAGYVVGRNVSVEYRAAEGDYERLPELVADFVRRRVDVIVAVGGARPALAVKAATSMIPIVFADRRFRSD